MAHDVFVSYSHQNRAAADAVVHVLEAAGVRCWYAPRDIVPGADWSTAIVQAIHASRMMVLLLAAPTFASPQVPREVERAINKGVPVVPVRLEDVALEGAFEYYLSTAHWLDAFTPSLDAHLDTLRASVLTLLALRPRAGDTADRPVADHSAPDRPAPDRPAPDGQEATSTVHGFPAPAPDAALSAASASSAAADARARRSCPQCAELVLVDAQRCRYCSADLHAPAPTPRVPAPAAALRPAPAPDVLRWPLVVDLTPAPAAGAPAPAQAQDARPLPNASEPHDAAAPAHTVAAQHPSAAASAPMPSPAPAVRRDVPQSRLAPGGGDGTTRVAGRNDETTSTAETSESPFRTLPVERPGEQPTAIPRATSSAAPARRFLAVAAMVTLLGTVLWVEVHATAPPRAAPDTGDTALSTAPRADATGPSAGGFLGVELGQQPGDSVRIMEVVPGSEAEKAGLQVGDIFVAIESHDVIDVADARAALRAMPPGSSGLFTYSRNGVEGHVIVTIGRRR